MQVRPCEFGRFFARDCVSAIHFLALWVRARAVTLAEPDGPEQSCSTDDFGNVSACTVKGQQSCVDTGNCDI